jgi:hypothetical protein
LRMTMASVTRSTPLPKTSSITKLSTNRNAENGFRLVRKV